MFGSLVNELELQHTFLFDKKLVLMFGSLVNELELQHTFLFDKKARLSSVWLEKN